MVSPHTPNESARDRIIMALDVESRDAALRLVDALDDDISFFKVGYQLFVAEGMSFVDELVERKKRIFLDLKMDDVGATIALAVEVVAKHDVHLLTIHGGSATARAALKGRSQANRRLPNILSLTLLTSLDSTDLEDLGVIGEHAKCKSLDEYVDWRAQQAVDAGCDGLITAGGNVERLRAKHPDTLIVTPGIRLRSDDSDDHKRPATPRRTIAHGADYLVIGRPIRDADPGKRLEVIESVANEIELGLEDRNRRRNATHQ
ncbi:MAG: orotidine-5'-phosphate decarboxylase [Thiotrichales bacterium]|nr:orotidine-5'-phosphate decarboxylase [Thiotrichales bacterium]